jgi:serine/threonine-protein kinase
VIGLRLQDAEATLREQQLKLRKIERSTTDRARPDTILSQAPEPSTTIAPGCFVDVVVAVAVPKVTVPNFVGMTQAQALELLPRIVAGRSGLTLGSVVYRDIRAPAGTVVDQNPRPGAVVEAGTPVGLVIARPQAPPDDRVTVPNVQGMVRRQAEAVLNRLKLRLEVRVEYRRSGYKEGQVISQAPKPGERVPPGTVVQLVVATTIG